MLCPLCFPEHRRRHPECLPGRTHVCLSSQRTVLGKATTGLPRHREALTGRAAVRLLPQTAHRRRQTPRIKLWCSKPSQGLLLLPRVVMSRTWPGELLGLWLLQTESPTRSSVHRDGADGETRRGREPAGASRWPGMANASEAGCQQPLGPREKLISSSWSCSTLGAQRPPGPTKGSFPSGQGVSGPRCCPGRGAVRFGPWTGSSGFVMLKNNIRRKMPAIHWAACRKRAGGKRCSLS